MRPMKHLPKFAALSLSIGALLATSTPADAHETPAEAANKQVVLDFYRALNDADAAGAMKTRAQTIVEKYIGPDYLQHSDALANLPGPGTSRDKLIRMFQSMPPMKAAPPKTVAVMAQDDLVMMLTTREMPDPATGQAKQSYIFNMFRIYHGRLVEHWDVSQMPPPPGGP